MVSKKIGQPYKKDNPTDPTVNRRLLSVVLYFRYVLVYFPATYPFFTDYIKHIQYAARHVFFFNLFLKEPLHKLESHKVFQLDAFVSNVVKLLGHIHLLFEHFLKYRTERFERSEEHTSELQSLMRISYAVFCLKKKN